MGGRGQSKISNRSSKVVGTTQTTGTPSFVPWCKRRGCRVIDRRSRNGKKRGKSDDRMATILQVTKEGYGRNADDWRPPLSAIQTKEAVEEPTVSGGAPKEGVSNHNHFTVSWQKKGWAGKERKKTY